MIDLYSEWFYRSGSNYYVLKDYTYQDEEGNTESDLIKIRLIRKKNLPQEIMYFQKNSIYFVFLYRFL